MFKKEIATANELDLRPLGKVIIFRDKQPDKHFLLYIDRVLRDHILGGVCREHPLARLCCHRSQQ